MKKREWIKKGIAFELICIAAASVIMLKQRLETLTYDNASQSRWENTVEGKGKSEEAVDVVSKDYIKWVDFKVPYEVLCKAYELDKETWGEEVHIEWIPFLSYFAAKGGGEFPNGTVQKMEKTADSLINGETDMKTLTEDLKYYDYYLEAYTAVLGGMVGEYRIETLDEDGNKVWKECYGLKAFSPIAKGFPYNDYDDFGASRSYGYARPHLGHDMMGQVGTPVVAIESGYVEAIGWNQYGGWRLGIRSFDGKRYYYYAHLRQNFPYCKDLEEGSIVTAGDVIGYMGHTGYSKKENVNNIKTTHLHWGLQLIFDESQKEGNNEIWIDCYPLTKFLYRNRSEAVKEEGTKEWRRVYRMEDPAVEEYRKGHGKR
ncbi:MAG: M23 family metallopeptidase [Clostridiales bacterium]|nr:M23 family metallopeptidase [Clostridiales bacterium]